MARLLHKQQKARYFPDPLTIGPKVEKSAEKTLAQGTEKSEPKKPESPRPNI